VIVCQTEDEGFIIAGIYILGEIYDHTNLICLIKTDKNGMIDLVLTESGHSSSEVYSSSEKSRNPSTFIIPYSFVAILLGISVGILYEKLIKKKSSI